MALLKVLLTSCCEEHDVAPKLVASMEDLEALALDPSAPNPALSGCAKRCSGMPLWRCAMEKLRLLLKAGKSIF